MRKHKPFKNVSENSWLGGVCGGIAYALGIPVLWLRISVIIILFCFTNPFFDYVGQFIVWFYILAWAFGSDWDEDPEDYEKRTA